MRPVTHQTVRLSRGRHASPEDGACVMELASMLAGEPFSDHPMAVCPVIGACLRAYNDWIDDGRREDLYAYAAKVVGTRASCEVQRARAERVRDWAAIVAPRPRRRSPLVRALRTLILWSAPEDIGSQVIRTVIRHGRGMHEQVLALIDELVALGGSEGTPVAVPPDAIRGTRPEGMVGFRDS